jgi:UDP-2,3-diacylglucosamine pyrophosphatase LpxH
MSTPNLGPQPVDAAWAVPAKPIPAVRTIFVSDLHIGTAGFQADAFLDFLRETRCDTLYLVGDIVDGWQLKRRWFWPQSHNDVIQKLLRSVRKGCRVVYVPGNHDEFARPFCGNSFGGVEVCEQAVHVTATGAKLWVIHGDQFDAVVQCAKWLAYVGDFAYEQTLKLNRQLNALRARMGLPYWSLSQFLKGKVKKALNYVSQFENAVATEAKKRGYQGVVCGHIHRAELRDVAGVLYANDGDWVESRTALVETQTGELQIWEWGVQHGLQGYRVIAQHAALPGVVAPAGRPTPVPTGLGLAANTMLATTSKLWLSARACEKDCA